MKWTTIIGTILLILILTGIFITLNFAQKNIGQAINIAKEQGNIQICNQDEDCPQTQKCIKGYCRPATHPTTTP